jgi:hypothetical protein
MNELFSAIRKTMGPIICGAAFVALGCQTAAAPRVDETNSRIASSLQGLQRFQASHSLNDLKETVGDLLSAVDIRAIEPGNYIARRRTVVQAWARVFNVIEHSYDPAYDPSNTDDLPENCVEPPLDDYGRELPGCPDPASIRDPKARAAYLAAVRANGEKTKRYNFYTSLHNIDGEAMEAMQLTLNDFRVAAPPDAPALDFILRQAGISSERRRKIDAMF